jgi:transposase
MSPRRTRSARPVGPRARRVKARRGRLAEGGAVAATGLTQMAERLALVAEPEDRRVPPPARPVLALPVEPLRMVDDKVRAPEPQRLAWQRTREVSQRLVTLPAVGPITATARVATLGDPAFFTAARPFSAWLGRTPRRPSTGGREWLGRISKRGEGHRRRLLLSGARPRPPESKSRRRIKVGSMPGSRGDPAMASRWPWPAGPLGWPGRCRPAANPSTPPRPPEALRGRRG